VLGALAAGCTPAITDTTGILNIATQAAILVDPRSFLGLVPCGNQPGAMRSYVATVTDQTDSARPFTLPSSPPTPCSQSVYFQFVTVGDVYTAEVDGYEEPPDEIVAVCSVSPPNNDKAPFTGGACSSHTECLYRGCTGRCDELVPNPNDQSVLVQTLDDCTPGSVACTCQYTSPTPGDRHLVRLDNGDPVTPRWTMPSTQPCGAVSGGAGTAAVSNADVSLERCGTLEDHGGTTPTSIRIIPNATLGTLACASPGGGTVTAFDITPEDASLPPVVMNPCSSPPTTVTFDQQITPKAKYMFTIKAYEGQATPSQTASCRALTAAGQEVVAVCDPLVPIKSP
jgi:hypothetical protein